MRAFFWLVVLFLHPLHAVHGGPPSQHKPDLQAIFDQSHAQIFSPYNPTFEGYTRWARLLTRRGVRVHLNTRPLHQILARHGKGTVLIMGIAIHHHGYTSKTLRAVLGFVKRGGGLLVMTEHDNLFEVSTRQNKLAQLFGVKALPLGIFTKQKNTGNPVWIQTSLPAWGLSKVFMYYVAPLVLTPPARPLLLAHHPTQKEHAVMGAMITKGQGRCVILGDAEWNWDGNRKMGLTHAQNTSFAWSLFAWLAQTSPRAYKEKQPTSFPSDKAQHKKTHLPQAVFLDPQTGLSPNNAMRSFAKALELRGYHIKIAQHPTALQQAALVIVPQPVQALSKAYLDALSKARRIVFIADGTSDFLQSYPHIRKLFRRLLKHPVAWPLPFDAFTSPWGFRFAQGTILSARKNSLEAPAQWTKGGSFLLFRGTYLHLPSPPQKYGWTILARTAPSTWFSPTLMGIYKDNGKHINPFLAPPIARQKGGKPVIAFTSRLFVASDLELFTEEGFQTPAGRVLWKYLLRWLETSSSTSKPTSRPPKTSRPFSIKTHQATSPLLRRSPPKK